MFSFFDGPILKNIFNLNYSHLLCNKYIRFSNNVLTMLVSLIRLLNLKILVIINKFS